MKLKTPLESCICSDRFICYVVQDRCKGCGKNWFCEGCLLAHENSCLEQVNDLLRSQLRSLGVDPDKLP